MMISLILLVIVAGGKAAEIKLNKLEDTVLAIPTGNEKGGKERMAESGEQKRILASGGGIVKRGQNLTLNFIVGSDWERCYWFRYEDKEKATDSHCSFDFDFDTALYSLRRCSPRNMSSVMVASGTDPKSCQITVPSVDETEAGVWAARLDVDRDVLEVEVIVAVEMGEVDLVMGELKAGVETNISCQVTGGKPVPSLVMSLSGEDDVSSSSVSSISSTTSTLTFTPSPQHHGQNVTCFAVQVDGQNTSLYEKQQNVTLDVLFAPQSGTDNASNIQVLPSASATFPLALRSNPGPDSVVWTVDSCEDPLETVLDTKNETCLTTIFAGQLHGKYTASNVSQSLSSSDPLLYLMDLTIGNVTDNDFSTKYSVIVTNTEGSQFYSFTLLPATTVTPPGTTQSLDEDSDASSDVDDGSTTEDTKDAEDESKDYNVALVVGILILVVIIGIVMVVVYKARKKNTSEEQPLTSNK